MGTTRNRFLRPQKATALLVGLIVACSLASSPTTADEDDFKISQIPLFIDTSDDAPPLTMLVMGRDHTLYYEAYNDASDLDDDGVLDVGYKPNAGFDYFGYFDSHLCYEYSASSQRFEPSAATGDGKTCSGDDEWSGDFLNYITTARIDALRKVLYGGRRVVDTADETVLERSYIPQDAHSWGKEYLSEVHDGYDIRNYTPLPLPTPGTRHLFANTTPSNSTNKEPLMRYLNDSTYRIWQWVAKESPVAGIKCGSSNCAAGASTQLGDYPTSASSFQTMITSWGTSTQLCGTGNLTGGYINTSGSNNNPYYNAGACAANNDHEYYLTIIKGQINISTSGDYKFAVNGDDATEVLIDGTVITGRYGGNGAASGSTVADKATNSGTIKTVTLTAGWHELEYHHMEKGGGDNYQLMWSPPGGSWAYVPAASLRGSGGSGNISITTYSLRRTLPASAITDYVVRVKVCDASLPDSNCTQYPGDETSGVTLKPTGLLQKYGENDKMLFGLLSGSYTYPYNMQGGVLRKNITSFTDEVDSETGIFTATKGIVYTIDNFRIVDFGGGSDTGGGTYTGGWLATAAMPDSTSKKFPDWGNPIAEMMYETLRYFSGKPSPTGSFLPTRVTVSGNLMEKITLKENSPGLSSFLYLPAPDWTDPYAEDNGAYYCSPGAGLVISDVNPSYDTESVPGSYFASFSGDISGLDAADEADAIWSIENGDSSSHFIGQVGSTYDGAPTAKSVSGLGNIRGLSPSEPTKQGSYYSAAIARYGYTNDLRSDLTDKQDINTFSVALASPLPKLEIPVGDTKVTVVPFAKSVGEYSINATKGQFQPTNTIVDFFIETFANTASDGSDANAGINGGRPYMKFRINYEDVEQGADHDMDAISSYELIVNADDTLTINMVSEYASGSIIQHMGYVISGTTHDGPYLDVRDTDTGSGSDVDYFLDTPAGELPEACSASTPPTGCTGALPLSASRTFSPGSDSSAATVLEGPLWYAAKYGSTGNTGLATYKNPNASGKSETSPNYFLVTNAGRLQQQLEDAFERIIALSKATSSSAAASSTKAVQDTVIYQAKFDADDWTGDLVALEDLFAESGETTTQWSAAEQLASLIATSGTSARNIYTWNPDAETPTGIAFLWSNLTDTQKTYLSTNEDVQKSLVAWLRGGVNADYRARGALDGSTIPNPLGDIVNSDPLYVGAPKNAGYANLPSGTGGQSTYANDGGFLATYATRQPMVYVGANDGMLHGFNADTGEEVLAYVPNSLFPILADLASTTYKHHYFVDGSPYVGDAFIGGAWRSVLIGSLGAGGKSVFALDVTDPIGHGFTADNVLWEFTDSNMGQMVGQMTSSAVIGRLATGQWAAIFGNGYDSGTGAWLYIVNLEDGSLIRKIQVSTDTTNGLSAAALIRDSSRTIAGVYVGDLKGNLWKIDLTGKTSASWNIAYSGTPLFEATDDASTPNPQAITAPLEVSAHPLGGYLIYFGTGQYMRATDPADVSVQTAYGIWDNSSLTQSTSDPTQAIWSGGSAITEGRDALIEQEILLEGSLSDLNADEDRTITDGDYEWRVLSQNSIDWGTLSSPTDRGWLLDLVSPATEEDDGEHGERVISRAQLLPASGQVLFTTLIPTTSENPCEGGDGKSWVMALDMYTGGRSKDATFDLNGDGVFNDSDLLTVTIDGQEVVVSMSGFREDQIIDSPRVLQSGNDYSLVTAGSSGEDAKVAPGIQGTQNGRLGWRQLR